MRSGWTRVVRRLIQHRRMSSASASQCGAPPGVHTHAQKRLSDCTSKTDQKCVNCKTCFKNIEAPRLLKPRREKDNERAKRARNARFRPHERGRRTGRTLPETMTQARLWSRPSEVLQPATTQKLVIGVKRKWTTMC